MWNILYDTLLVKLKITCGQLTHANKVVFWCMEIHGRGRTNKRRINDTSIGRTEQIEGIEDNQHVERKTEFADGEGT